MMFNPRGLYAVILLAVCIALSGCAYGKHIDKGDEYFEQGRYEQALREYEEAQRLEPDSEEAAQKIDAARMGLVRTHVEKARGALGADDILGAMDATSAAYEHLPQLPQVARLIEDVAADADRRAKDFGAARSWAQALMLYDSASRQLPPKRTFFAQKAEEVRGHWGEDLRACAQQAEAAQLPARALLCWGQLQQLAPDEQAAERIPALRSALKETYQYVTVLDGNTKDPTFRAISQTLSGEAEPGTLRIQTQKTSAPRSNTARAQVKITAPRFENSRSDRTETVRYQSGTEQVKNPSWDHANQRLMDEERRLVDRQKEVTRYENDVTRYQQAVQREGPTPNVTTGAEQNLSNAQSRLTAARRAVDSQRDQVLRAREDLARTDQFKTEPVYSDLTYTISTITRRATLSVAVQITHGDGRAPLEASQPVEVSASADTHAAQPAANIAELPLYLPHDQEYVAGLQQEAARIVQAQILASFDGWRNGLVAQGDEATSAEERTNQLAIYILTDPHRAHASVVDELAELSGIPDPVRALLRE